MVMKMSKKSSRGRDNHVCLVCHLTFKGTSTCPICRRPMLGLSHKMRVPARRDGKGYLTFIKFLVRFNDYYKERIKEIYGNRFEEIINGKL